MVRVAGREENLLFMVLERQNLRNLYMKISVAVPYHNTPMTGAFLARLCVSYQEQDYKEKELILTNKGNMGENHNQAIEESTGDIIKMLQMDDYLLPGALEKTAQAFLENPDKSWLITANLHFDGEKESYPHMPEWNHQIFTGRNTLGSVSTLSIRKDTLLFNPDLKWLIDTDLYWRLYQNYGPPILLLEPTVVVSWHQGQQTNLLSNEEKQKEIELCIKKYGK